MMFDPDMVPSLPRGVRLKKDEVRGNWVLLAPERALALDPIGLAILSEIDGERSLGRIATDLAEKFEAPLDQILGDCAEYMSALVDRRIVDVAP